MVNSPLLDMQFDYWRRFIRDDGSLDKEKMLANGYDGEGQIEWLEKEMKERGWIGVPREPIAKTGGVSSIEPNTAFPVVFSPRGSKEKSDNTETVE